MPYSSKPSLSPSQKPVNVFYVWYSELCRRLNCTPAPVVKPAKTKCQTVLDFVADRLKAEEWNPVINALRNDTSLHVISIRSRVDKCQFLHEIDSEQKVRQMKRRCGLIWTAYILKSLLKSLTVTIKNSQVLTCLEFDGIPMFTQYLEPLLKALRNNNTLKTLSLTRCRINDVGCQLVCAYVRFTPNIEVLNLSCCGLTAESGDHLAKLIKYQQINRYCESWHNSLRYSDPNVHVMRGIKRITLNCNPFFGDEGLDLILNELDDDLWIKALDMQQCGITENISMKILNVIDYNQSLEIVDFRLNDQLHIATMEKILTILKQKQGLDYQPEFQWCNTTLTLTCDSVVESLTNFTSINNSSIQKTKSAPIKQVISKISSNLRKAKTTENFSRNTNYINFKDAEKKMRELNYQLQAEIAKRRETEKINEQLKRKLEEISSVTSFSKQGNIKSLITDINHITPKPNRVKKKDEKVNTVDIFKKMCNKNGLTKIANGFKGEASCIFKTIVEQNCTNSDDNVDGLVGYYNNTKTINGIKNEKQMYSYNNDVSASQISLINYMETLKKSSTRNGFINNKNCNK